MRGVLNLYNTLFKFFSIIAKDDTKVKKVKPQPKNGTTKTAFTNQYRYAILSYYL